MFYLRNGRHIQYQKTSNASIYPCCYSQYGKNISFCTLLHHFWNDSIIWFHGTTVGRSIFSWLPTPKFICGGFAKRLASAIAQREAQHQENGHDQTYILQLWEWPGVGAIKRHLVTAGRYPKEVWEKVIFFFFFFFFLFYVYVQPIGLWQTLGRLTVHNLPGCKP